MENEDLQSRKKDILNIIFIKEEDTLRDLEEIVNKSSKHFKINLEGEKKILFEDHIVNITSKILLLLIGIYLMKHNGSRNSDSINIANISKDLGIKKTSLSKPIGILLSKGYLKKDSMGNYSIEHHKIKKILEELEN